MSSRPVRSRRHRVISALASLLAADIALWFESYAYAALFAVLAVWSAASLLGWWSVEDRPRRSDSRLTRLADADWLPPLAAVASAVWLIAAFYLAEGAGRAGFMPGAFLPLIGLGWLMQRRQALAGRSGSDQE